MLIRLSRLQIFAVLFAAFLFTACAQSAEPIEDIPGISTQTTSPTAIPQDDTFPEIPPEARIATWQGDPRPAAYWALWNTCAPENRADIAAENGGRSAGFILLDDLLINPGIQLGNFPVTTCEEGLALLQGHTAVGDDTDDPVYGLAAELLTAELNLNVGAESCPIAEEAVVGGHLVLSQVDFNGLGEYATDTPSEIFSSIPRLVELLQGYNRGELCR